MSHATGVAAALLLAAIVAPPAGAQQQDDDRIEWIEVAAPSLEGNRLDTPTVQRTGVYLPPSYDAEPERRYPTLYLLHGIFDSPDVWIRHFELPAKLDEAIAAGRLKEMIVVMPTGRNLLGGGFYRNSSVSGGWGDFIRRDVVAHVDAHYRTIPDRESRAIAGHSMGGFGSIWHAMTSADVFSIVFAMSPAVLDVEDDVSHGNVAAWRNMLQMRGREGLDETFARRDFWAVATWAVCTAFLPDLEDETYLCDPPVRLEGFELVPEEAALDRWRTVLPVTAARDHVTALRSLRGLALDYGFDDQFAHIPETTQRLSDELARLRVPHELHVYRGDHRQQLKPRLYEVVLPWISARLVERTPAEP